MKLSILMAAMIFVSPMGARAEEVVSDDKTDAGVAAMGLCNDCLTPIFDERIDQNRAKVRETVNWFVDPKASGGLPALDSEATR